jgi:hypothetical protein
MFFRKIMQVSVVECSSQSLRDSTQSLHMMGVLISLREMNNDCLICGPKNCPRAVEIIERSISYDARRKI